MPHLPGITLHRSLGIPPRIWASCDHADFGLDISVGQILSCAINIFAVSHKFPSVDDIFNLIFHVEACHDHMTVRIMEQVELVLVLLRNLLLYWHRGSEVNLAPRVDKDLLD